MSGSPYRAGAGVTAPSWLSDPSDYGLLAFNFPPINSPGTTALATAGTIYGSKLRLTSALTVTNVHLHVGTAGGTLTSGQCFVALFDASKNLIGVSADQATAWASTGFKTIALASGPFAVPAGIVYAAAFFNGTTGPALARAGNVGVINSSLSGANSNSFSADTGRTTAMPSTLGSFTGTAVGYWFGLS